MDHERNFDAVNAMLSGSAANQTRRAASLNEASGALGQLLGSIQNHVEGMGELADRARRVADRVFGIEPPEPTGRAEAGVGGVLGSGLTGDPHIAALNRALESLSAQGRRLSKAIARIEQL